MLLHWSMQVLACFTIFGLLVSSERDIFKPRTFTRITADKDKTRFTAEEKQLILQIQNSYRSLVQPPAKYMKELVWDDDLEEYSWNHTQKCTGWHSDARMSKHWSETYTEDWYNMGENLYFAHAPSYSLENAFHLFWIEGQNFNIYNRTCAPNEVCGHYIVMTTADSWRVGCAMNTCNNFSASKYPVPAIFLSCTYNGMFIDGMAPYEVGARGTSCNREESGSEGRYCRYGLCTSTDRYWKREGFNGNTSVIDQEPLDAASACGDNQGPTSKPATSSASTDILPLTSKQPVTPETPTPVKTVATKTHAENTKITDDTFTPTAVKSANQATQLSVGLLATTSLCLHLICTLICVYCVLC